MSLYIINWFKIASIVSTVGPCTLFFIRLSVSHHSRFLLQLVGVLLDDISTRRVKVDITEQQHTFYCQQLGTLLMCLIHVFKSGEHTPLDCALLCRTCVCFYQNRIMVRAYEL